jgi:hypothetical protein
VEQHAFVNHHPTRPPFGQRIDDVLKKKDLRLTALVIEVLACVLALLAAEGRIGQHVVELASSACRKAYSSTPAPVLRLTCSFSPKANPPSACGITT